MKNDGIITLSSVPTDIEQARLLKAKIEAYRVTLHPEHSEKIIEKLEKVLSGQYKENEIMKDDEFLIEFESRQIRAREREAKRNMVREPLKSALQAIQEAENLTQSWHQKYEYQYELTKSKLSILKVLKALELESNDILEQNSRTEF